jgi:hypothetical protein
MHPSRAVLLLLPRPRLPTRRLVCQRRTSGQTSPSSTSNTHNKEAIPRKDQRRSRLLQDSPHRSPRRLEKRKRNLQLSQSHEKARPSRGSQMGNQNTACTAKPPPKSVSRRWDVRACKEHSRRCLPSTWPPFRRIYEISQGYRSKLRACATCVAGMSSRRAT